LGGSCPAADVDAVTPPAVGSAPVEAEPLAADFVPTSATRCTFTMAIFAERARGPVDPTDPSVGQSVPQSRQRSAGPFGDLVRALRSPPETHAGDVQCPASLEPAIAITLTDAGGRTVTPAIPANVCGAPVEAVRRAADALIWQPVDTPPRPAPAPSD
jgi:hypothetical protein